MKPLRRPKQRHEGKKNRKHGRNLKKCAAYKLARKREKSHIRRIEKHLARFPGDLEARVALERWFARV